MGQSSRRTENLPIGMLIFLWMTCTTPAPARNHADLRREKNQNRARQLEQMRASSKFSGSFSVFGCNSVIFERTGVPTQLPKVREDSWFVMRGMPCNGR